MVWRFLADYEATAEDFWAELVREQYLNRAGLKSVIEITPIYERYPSLFDREAVDELLEHTADRRSRYLADFAVFGYLSDRVKTLTERITNAVTQATIEWDDRPVPYRLVPTLIANEPDPDRRHDLERLAGQRTAEINPDRVERWRTIHQETQDLGYINYVELCERLRGLDLEVLAGQMRALLDRTADHYFEGLDHYLRGIGVPRTRSTPADLTRMARAPEFDPLFPREKLLSSLRQTLAGLGINLDRQHNVELDVTPRPLKSPRAFCASIRVPGEIKLVMMPRGGFDDYRALFHEAGHTEHFANTDREVPFAFKRLGDVAATELFAFLFQHLIENPVWLQDIGGISGVDEYLRLARFLRLRLVRRYAAKLLYELELQASSQIEPMADRYAEILSEAQGVEVPRVNYLEDVDDGFYVAQYLRAWMGEAQVRAFLTHELGENWFAKRSAGDFLRDLWQHGLEYTADEIVHQCGHQRLEPDMLIEDLVAGEARLR